MNTIIILLTFLIPLAPVKDNSYDVWREDGVHLFINDNGTPTNYEDDWVYDWEDNREVDITIID